MQAFGSTVPTTTPDEALQAGIAGGSVDMLEQALNGGANASALCASTLTFCCTCGHLELVKYLVAVHGMDPFAAMATEPPLLRSCRFMQLDVAAYLLSLPGVDASVTYGGCTALHLLCEGTAEASATACKATQRQVAAMLLEAGCDVMARDACGSTALHKARRSLRLTELLLAHPRAGELAAACNARGVNAAMLATSAPILKAIEAVDPASLLAADAYGASIWHHVLRGRHEDILEYLATKPEVLAVGLHADMGGEAPVMLACRLGAVELVVAFVAAGAVVDDNLWFCVCEGGHPRMVQLMLDMGVPTAAVLAAHNTTAKQTPLDVAVSKLHLAAACVLVANDVVTPAAVLAAAGFAFVVSYTVSWTPVLHVAAANKARFQQWARGRRFLGVPPPTADRSLVAKQVLLLPFSPGTDRFLLLDLFVNLWREEGAAPVAADAPNSRLAAACRLRRLCRVRGPSALDMATELVEPFGREVALFL